MNKVSINIAHMQSLSRFYRLFCDEQFQVRFNCARSYPHFSWFLLILLLMISKIVEVSKGPLILSWCIMGYAELRRGGGWLGRTAMYQHSSKVRRSTPSCL